MHGQGWPPWPLGPPGPPWPSWPPKRLDSPCPLDQLHHMDHMDQMDQLTNWTALTSLTDQKIYQEDMCWFLLILMITFYSVLFLRSVAIYHNHHHHENPHVTLTRYLSTELGGSNPADVDTWVEVLARNHWHHNNNFIIIITPIIMVLKLFTINTMIMHGE